MALCLIILEQVVSGKRKRDQYGDDDDDGRPAKLQEPRNSQIEVNIEALPISALIIKR